MKLLVTGRTGQLAHALLERSGRADIEVTSIARPLVDLTDETSIVAAIAHERPDVVVNAAAYTAVDRAESEAALAHAVNSLGAESVARACSAKGIPLIHISTDFVFDGTKDGPYAEDDRTGPLNVYGVTKLDGEHRVARACARHIILRTSWLHSPWGSNFVKTMLRLAGARPSIAVVDDQWGTPTFVPDLADIVLAVSSELASHPESVQWGLYHAAGSGETTWCGFAREIFQCAAEQGLPFAAVEAITTANYPTPARRPANSRLSCDRLRLRFGLQAPDWRQGVRDCVARLAQPSPH